MMAGRNKNLPGEGEPFAKRRETVTHSSFRRSERTIFWIKELLPDFYQALREEGMDKFIRYRQYGISLTHAAFVGVGRDGASYMERAVKRTKACRKLSKTASDILQICADAGRFITWDEFPFKLFKPPEAQKKLTDPVRYERAKSTEAIGREAMPKIVARMLDEGMTEHQLRAEHLKISEFLDKNPEYLDPQFRAKLRNSQ